MVENSATEEGYACATSPAYTITLHSLGTSTRHSLVATFDIAPPTGMILRSLRRYLIEDVSQLQTTFTLL